jgi:hypothetical protein
MQYGTNYEGPTKPEALTLVTEMSLKSMDLLPPSLIEKNSSTMKRGQWAPPNVREHICQTAHHHLKKYKSSSFLVTYLLLYQFTQWKM